MRVDDSFDAVGSQQGRHLRKHRRRELEVEEGVDQKGCPTGRHEACVAPAPTSVRLKICIYAIRNLLKPMPESRAGPCHPTKRFRNTPMRSISSSTTSPSCRKRPRSKPQPVPTVPEPITSPGCRVSDWEMKAMIASNGWCMAALLPRLHSSPFTRATIVSECG